LQGSEIKTSQQGGGAMAMKYLGFVLAGSLVGLTPMPLHASGSGGSGGAGYSSSFPEVSAPRDPFADAFLRGKSHFKKRITCKTCAFPQGIADNATAAKLAERVKSGEFGLDARQQADLMVFLNRRYGVTA
jgi:hypothetical protein